MFNLSLTSKLTVARTGTTSLRATVPEGIVAFLELKEGNKLNWKMEIIDGERVVIVRKVKSNDAIGIALKYMKSQKENDPNE